MSASESAGPDDDAQVTAGECVAHLVGRPKLSGELWRVSLGNCGALSIAAAGPGLAQTGGGDVATVAVGVRSTGRLLRTDVAVIPVRLNGERVEPTWLSA